MRPLLTQRCACCYTRHLQIANAWQHLAALDDVVGQIELFTRERRGEALFIQTRVVSLDERMQDRGRVRRRGWSTRCASSAALGPMSVASKRIGRQRYAPRLDRVQLPPIESEAPDP